MAAKSNNFALYVLMFNMFIAMSGIGLIIPIMPEYLDTFGVAGQALGTLIATFALAQFLFSPLSGQLSDKYGRKKLIIFGLIIFGLSQLVFGLASDLWILYLARFFSGLGAAFLIPPMMAFVADITTFEERGKGMGLLGASMSLGFMVGPGFGGFLAEVSLQFPFYVATAVALIAAVISFFALPNVAPTIPSVPAKAENLFQQLKRSTTTPYFVMLLVMLILASNSGDTDLATRLVLISDGNETKASALDSLNRLQSERVQIDVLPIQQDSSQDVAITSFETPSKAFLGESQAFSLTLQSDGEREAELVFSKNDEEFDRHRIQLVDGENVFSYRYPASEEGLLKYEARLEIAEDRFLENNALVSITEVEGKPELLVVNGTIPSPIPGFLDGENIRTTNIDSNELPASLSSILQYDGIIFDNVSGTSVGGQQMDVIEQAVKQFGVGFMMVGGDQSYGLGGYFKSPIERLLPVEMEVKGKHELPSLGLIIVMDRSGSMAGMKMELAKEAAARSVELLREDDTVGVIAFDDQPWQIVETEKLADPKAAADKILSVTPGGGTEIFRSLTEAYGQLEGLELQRKHIILLTDGQSPPSDYTSLIEGGKEDNITLSTVSIGQDADIGLLEDLAATGNGRFYEVADATTIPAILSRETIMMSRTYIVDEPFYPIVYDSPWSDLFSDGVPQMNAYIATTAKPEASVALESEEGDPVLASWNYGLGKTIAYTSGSSAWSGDFQSWKNWPVFWNRSVSELLPSYDEIPFTVARKQQGVYTIEDPTRQSAIIEVAAINEKGVEIPLQSEPVAPGKMEVTLDADPGLVFFSIRNENGEAYKTGLTIPYGDEYRLSEPNTALLASVAERSGGSVLGSLEESLREIPYESGTNQPIQHFLLLLAMVLFFIDITIRRFGLRFIPSLKKPKAAVSSSPEALPQTIEQLIKAKKRG